MSRRASRTALLSALVAAAGCATPARRVDVNDPAMRERLAVMSLLEEDFGTARPRLLDLVARCESGEHGRRALLLLAAAELDPQNEAGSPEMAARLARAYLLLPDAPREEIVLARALYRLAADLGGLEETAAVSVSAARGPTVAPRFDACGRPADLRFRPLPATSEQTLARRMHLLEAQLAAQADSLARLKAQSDSLAIARAAVDRSRQRVAELEQEIERITQLLTSGAESDR